MSFDHLKSLDVSNRTARCMLSFQTKAPEPGEDLAYPVLIVKSATEANRVFANEQLRMTKKTAPAVRAGAINMQMIAETRDNDRTLYAKHIVVGWEGIYDSNGEEVPFSNSECEIFLRALPDWAFDEIRNFCTNPQNWVEQMAVKAIAKN